MSQETRTPDLMQVCATWMEGRLFGFDILDVREVVLPLELAPTHHGPASVLGCVNLRGQIHVIVDLRQLFGFPPAVIGPLSRFVVFKTSVDEPFGVVVDAVEDVFSVRASEIVDRRRDTGDLPEPPAAGQERRCALPKLGQGVCQLDRGLLVVLNARAILENLHRPPPTSAPDRVP